MRLHPTDPGGDWLPAGAPGAGITGAEAKERLLRFRLALPRGAWWEDPSHGCPLPALVRDADRVTPADLPAIRAAVESYLIREGGM